MANTGTSIERNEMKNAIEDAVGEEGYPQKVGVTACLKWNDTPVPGDAEEPDEVVIDEAIYDLGCDWHIPRSLWRTDAVEAELKELAICAWKTEQEGRELNEAVDRKTDELEERRMDWNEVQQLRHEDTDNTKLREFANEMKEA
ncbi:MAG: hypothetical protein WC505_08045 [Patescibacteria group bacterium]